ncbi:MULTISPECIES: glycosyltransferase family 1 protein [unclassified Pseudomonas]|nr:MULTISPECIES: glycosyltransferase family 1 protein [unclassified Pseudomonas]
MGLQEGATPIIQVMTVLLFPDVASLFEGFLVHEKACGVFEG